MDYQIIAGMYSTSIAVISMSPFYFLIPGPDSKVHGGQHGAHLGPTEPRWEPCGPREPCYLGRRVNAIILLFPTLSISDLCQPQLVQLIHNSWRYVSVRASPTSLIQSLIARFMGPTWGPSGADRTQVGPMMASWTLLSGISRLSSNKQSDVTSSIITNTINLICLDVCTRIRYRGGDK